MKIALVMGRIEHCTGMARSVLEVSKYLAQQHDVTLVGPIDRKVVSIFSENIKVKELGLNNYIRPRTLRSYDVKAIDANLKAAKSTLSQSRILDSFLKESEFDIIDNWGNWSTFQDISTCRFCYSEYVNIIEKKRPELFEFKDKDKAQKVVLQLEKERFEAVSNKLIITNSNKVANELKKRYNISTEIKTIYNGVDFTRFNIENRKNLRSNKRKELGISEEQTVMMFVSTNYQRKNLQLILSTFPELPNQNNIELIILGVPEQGRKIISPNIKYIDFDLNVEQYLAISDILLLPTIYDACSNVVLEAAAMGIFSVTSDQAGAHEIFKNGKNIIVHNSNITTEQYVKLLTDILTKENTFELLGNEAYKAIKGFSWVNIVKTIEQNYEIVLRKKKEYGAILR